MSRRRNKDRTVVKVRDEKTRAVLAKAWTLIRSQQFDQARQLVESVLDRYPEHPSALLVAAMIALESSKVAPIIDADGQRIRSLDVAEEFVAHALEASRGDPWPDVHWMRSQVYGKQGRWTEALAAAETFLCLAPTRFQFYVDYAGLLSAVGRYEDALAAYDKASGLPDADEPGIVAFNRAMVLLALGRWDEGFRLYERRYEVASYPNEGGRHYPAEFPAQRWHGESISGQRLLVFWEQGFGDNLLLWDLLPWVVRQSQATIILETHGPLVQLALDDFPDVVVVKDGDPLPTWDRWVGVFSLPALAGKQLHWRRAA